MDINDRNNKEPLESIEISKDMNLIDFYKFETDFEAQYDRGNTESCKKEFLSVLGKLATKQLFIALSFEKEARDNALKQFRNHINKSDKLEIKHKNTLCLKGFFSFFKGDLRQANEYFENAKDMDNSYLPYLIGKGLLEYRQNRYSTALGFFKKIFSLYRHLVKRAAYLMGLCYFQLETLDLAEKCFNYCINKELGFDTECYVGIAQIRMKQDNYDDYFMYIKKAFQVKEQDSKRVNLLLNLSKYYFLKKDYVRAVKLADLCLKELQGSVSFLTNQSKYIRSDLDNVKSKLYYIKAFVNHSKNTQESLNEAYKNYQMAIRYNSLNLPAQFGCTKILYKKKNLADANKCIQIIISKQSENLYKQCYLIMPHIYMRLEKRKEAIDAFKKAMKYFPDNIRLLIDYAFYLETMNPKKAFAVYLDLYERLERLEKGSQGIPVEVLNNMLVSFINNGEYREAGNVLDHLNKELDSMKTEETNKQALVLTVKFNSAALLFNQSLIDQAIAVYQELINENPMFYDCYVELAKIYLLRNEKEKFDEVINKSLFFSYKQSKMEYPLYLQIQGLIKQKRFQDAINIVDKIKNSDNQIKLLRARIFYDLIAYNRTKIDEVKENIKKASILAFEVLNQPEESKNLYAANICACLLAEKGRIKDSLLIFRSFQDITENSSPLLYNLALAEFLDRNYEKALIILESPKSGSENRKSDLYAFLNILLNKYDKAEKVFKYKYMQNPSLSSYYNYVSFLLKKIKMKCADKKEQINDIEFFRNQLVFCQQAFKKIDSLIDPQMLSSLGGIVSEDEIKRKECIQLKRLCNKNYQFIEDNKGSYEKIFSERLSEINQIKKSKFNRKNMIAEKKRLENLKRLEEERIKALKIQELEEKAKKSRELANNITNDINQKMVEEQMRKERRKVKPKVPKEKKQKKIKKPKKPTKKQRKKQETEKSDELDEDSFVKDDISEEELQNFNIYGDIDHKDDEPLYNPFLAQKNNEQEIQKEAKPRLRRLQRKNSQNKVKIDDEEEDELLRPETAVLPVKTRKKKLIMEDDDDDSSD